MSAKSSVIHDCLSIKITTATFAQPRSYFLTAQCIHKDSNIDDSINETIPKYRTAASKSTKTPQFNSKKPFLLKFPQDIELSRFLEEYKVVFEAYTVVSIEENSNNKEAKLMGESVLLLADKKQQLLNKESIDDVITLEGILKIDQTEKRVPVGQASITIKIQQITEEYKDKDKTKDKAKDKAKDKDKNEDKDENKDDDEDEDKDEDKEEDNDTCTIQIQAPLVKWAAIKHSNCIMIQISRWWGTDIDLWPESFVHIIQNNCGEVVTATHPKSESLNFYEMLELPLDINESERNSLDQYPPFIFKLVDESSRQIIESFALPSSCLSVLNQYDFVISFGAQNKINLECCLWFHPNRCSMLNILKEEESMIMVQIELNEMRGFDTNCRYSCYVQIVNIKQSISNDIHSNKIKIDLNESMDWKDINESSMSSRRCWLHFTVDQCVDLDKLYLFCFDDIIHSNDHQMVVKIYKEAPNTYVSHSLIGFVSIPIQSNTNRTQHQFGNIKLLDPNTKCEINNKEMDISMQLFNHENALEFMRFPTPNARSESFPISISVDSNQELMDDTARYKEVLNSDLFQSIKSQLNHFPTKKEERPTQRLFEAIERELSSKQTKIQDLELEREEKVEEFKMITNEMMRLREESVSMKRLNQSLSLRLREIVKNDSRDLQNIDNLSINKLKSMLIKYVNGHKTEKNKRRNLENTLTKLIEKLKASKQIYHKLIKMQRTAQEQAEYIRKLQKKQNEIKEYRDTIVSQEQIIEKLEEMLSWAHKTIKSLQQKMELGNDESNRERELENEIIGLQQENEELRRQIQMRKTDKLHEIANDVDKLKDDLKAANYRNDGLQSQLKAGAGQFGEQIADLKIQISQLKTDDDVISFSNVSELSQLSDILDSVSITTDNSI